MTTCICVLLIPHVLSCNVPLLFPQFGPILDVEIIFNERGSKVSYLPVGIHVTDKSV